MDFVTDLWNSILTPGTTPALIKATHLSFVGLVLTLLAMLYSTRSLHFVALLTIACGLWAAITWFINEVEEIKRKEKLQAEKDGEKTEEAKAAGNPSSGSATATASGFQ